MKNIQKTLTAIYGILMTGDQIAQKAYLVSQNKPGYKMRRNQKLKNKKVRNAKFYTGRNIRKK